MKKRVDELVAGDMVDLEGDPYADPDHDESWMEFELAVVVESERGCQSCVVHFEQISVGFPPDHEVKIGDE